MPTYNYKCRNENCEVDIYKQRKSMREYKEPAHCPSCNELNERLNNDFCKNFKLVGGGWFATSGSYATDVRQVSLDVQNRIHRKNAGSGE